MHPPTSLLSLLLLVLGSISPLATAGPLYRQTPHIPLQAPQQLLLDTNPATQSLVATPPPSFNVQENSVGLLFTTGDGWSVEHVWLPLGQKLLTADSPRLPLRPHTARITTMIRSTVDKAAPEVLDRVVCEIWPRWNESRSEDVAAEERRQSIKFSRGDNLVRLADILEDKVWSEFREVEAYECVVVADEEEV